jgi:hypothetical protein
VIVPDQADTEVRDALLAYTGDQPPPTFTYDQVLTSGRRARRRRRFAVAGAGAAVVAVAAGAALAALPDTRATLPEPFTVAGPSWSTLDPAPFCKAAAAPPAGPTIAPATSVNEKNGYRIRIPTEPANHAAARFSCYLTKAVPPLLRAATFHRDTGTPAGAVPLQAFPVRVFDPARPGDTTPPSFSASAVVSDGQGVGDIGFGVGATSASVAEVTANCAGPDCTLRQGPNGETVTVIDVTSETGYHLVNVYVYRGDTTTFASASNGRPITASRAANEARSGNDYRPGRTDLPLTVDQLVELASAPELDLFPGS